MLFILDSINLMYAHKSMSWLIFVIGILIGMIIMTIIFWILYATRTLFYTNCPYQQRMCRSVDYFNHPTEALKGGNTLTDHLNINNNQIHYKRHLKSTDCTPGHDQVVKVDHPQYCIFYDTYGNSVTATNSQSGSNYYTDITNPNNGILTSQDCVPLPNESVISGEPKLQWHL